MSQVKMFGISIARMMYIENRTKKEILNEIAKGKGYDEKTLDFLRRSITTVANNSFFWRMQAARKD